MNKGNWFFTCNGPSKEYALDEKDKKAKKVINNPMSFFITEDRLEQKDFDVKCNNLEYYY
jgi:hypothetical protein